VTTTANAILTIDLDAVVANYDLLRTLLGNTECAAVVKADAYGLGVGRIAPALAAAGCDTFFVATVDEGSMLKTVLRSRWPGAEVHVLGGATPGTKRALAGDGLIPSLNSLEEIDAWKRLQAKWPTPLPVDIHIDTGMRRLGLPPNELATVVSNPERLTGLHIRYLMSHLACADEHDHPMNQEQLAQFRAALAIIPTAKAAFCNSAGIFLGNDYHFDLARPGIALYGANPLSSSPNPMTQVIALKGKILQVRVVDTPQTVGYGATYQFAGPARIATVGVGYADGFLRSLSNVGFGHVGDVRVPIVGRVSMDLIALDVSSVPENEAYPGAFIELIGPHNPVDNVARLAGTIGYEVLTRMGSRFHRQYVGGP
jgi:alanine racemase